MWVGAAVSFTFALGPAFFSDEMRAIIPAPYNGAAAQIVIKRYFILLQVCGGIALFHLFLEKLYLGKAIERLALAVLLITISLGLLGGFWLQPKLRELHSKKYDVRSSTILRAEADGSFKMWHGLSQTINLLMMGGLLVYLWRISNPTNGSRFMSASKVRG